MRRWLAEKLAPEAFDAERRLEWFRIELQDGRRWLAEFDVLAAFIDRLWAGETNHFRSLDEEPVASKWHWEISRFREQLRHPTPPQETTE